MAKRPHIRQPLAMQGEEFLNTFYNETTCYTHFTVFGPLSGEMK